MFEETFIFFLDKEGNQHIAQEFVFGEIEINKFILLIEKVESFSKYRIRTLL